MNKMSDSAYQENMLSASRAKISDAEHGAAVTKTREALSEIINRAANFADPDAADWMPSIYKIACEAAGVDPWPLLMANGYERNDIALKMP